MEAHRTTITIVDDDEGVRETFSDILEAKGFDVSSVTSGTEAIHAANTRPSQVYFIDLELPDIEGMELLKRLKAIDKRFVCIIITGHASLQNAINAVNDGADAYFVKPVNIEEILLNLNFLLDKLRMNQQLEESELKFRTITEHSAISMLIIQDGVIKYHNKTTEPLLGLSAGDLINGTLATLARVIHPDDQEIVALITHMLANPERSYKYNFTLRIIKINEKTSWIDAHIRTIPYQGRTAVSLSMLDVTEKVEGEQRLKAFIAYLEDEIKERKQKRDLRREEKRYLDEILKASKFKTEFMATVSHELRTPLNAIIGFTELIQEDWYGRLNQDQKEFILNINDAANHLLAMINQLLDISKIEAGKMELDARPVMLNDVIERVEGLITPSCMKKGLVLTVSGLETPTVVHADPLLLKEILMNLLGNAVKYTERGSVSIVVSDKQEHVEVTIVDTGIGIAPEDQERVFKEFERVDSCLAQLEVGTGLGLSLTRRLVNLHGGVLTLESEPGKGSNFTFTLPKHREKETGS